MIPGKFVGIVVEIDGIWTIKRIPIDIVETAKKTGDLKPVKDYLLSIGYGRAQEIKI